MTPVWPLSRHRVIFLPIVHYPWILQTTLYNMTQQSCPACWCSPSLSGWYSTLEKSVNKALWMINIGCVSFGGVHACSRIYNMHVCLQHTIQSDMGNEKHNPPWTLLCCILWVTIPFYHCSSEPPPASHTVPFHFKMLSGVRESN